MNFYPCGDDGPSSPPPSYCEHPYHERDLRPVVAARGRDYCTWHLSKKGYTQDLAMFVSWVKDAKDELATRKESLRHYKRAAPHSSRIRVVYIRPPS